MYLIEAPFSFTIVFFFCQWRGNSRWWYLQVARILMKTVSQLASGKQPVGTMAYMGKVQYLMQCKSAVNSGT
jgi:acyl-CoA oxidase